jgi:proteasome lid subunit RPN8/RPN11
VQSREGDATPLSLRMHAGVWDAAREALRPGEVVVGWYHSHPGIGAFFSDTDRRTQAGFFAQPFSLGWVIDPQRAEQAWFVGPQAQPLDLEAIVPIRTPNAATVLPRT